MKQLAVFAALALGMAFFGTGTPTAKVVTSGFPLLLAPFLRLLLAAALTTPLLFVFRDDVGRIGRRDWRFIVGIGSIGLVAFSLFLMTGMTMVNGVVGAMVMSTSPAAVALGAAWFLGDDLGPRKLAAVVLSVAGVVIINLAGEPFQASGGWTLVVGALLVFGTVASSTAYSLFAKQVSRSVRPALLIPLAAWVAVILLAVPASVQALRFDFAAPSLEQWLA